MILTTEDLTAIERIVWRDTTPPKEREPQLADFVRQEQGATKAEMTWGESWEGHARACENINFLGLPAIVPANIDKCWDEVATMQAVTSQEEWYQTVYKYVRPETAAFAILTGSLEPPSLMPLNPRTDVYIHNLLGTRTIAEYIDLLIQKKNAGSTGTGPGPGGY